VVLSAVTQFTNYAARLMGSTNTLEGSGKRSFRFASVKQLALPAQTGIIRQ